MKRTGNRVIIVWLCAIALVSVVALAVRLFSPSWAYGDPRSAEIAPLAFPGRAFADFAHPGFFPLGGPDIVLSFADPWSPPRSGGVRRPFVEPPSASWTKSNLSLDFLGLRYSKKALGIDHAVPEAREAWLAELDSLAAAKPGSPYPLLIAGKEDRELLAAIIWMAEALMGPDTLQETLAGLTKDTSFRLTGDGFMATDHPLKPAIAALIDWAAKGRLPKNWYTLSDLDIQLLLDEGKAAYALSYSSTYFTNTLDQAFISGFAPLPVPSGRRTLTSLGRWLMVERSVDIGAFFAVDAAISAASGSEVADRLFEQCGLIASDDRVSLVNQESRAVYLAFKRSGSLVSLPLPSSDLSSWKPLLEAARAELLRP